VFYHCIYFDETGGVDATGFSGVTQVPAAGFTEVAGFAGFTEVAGFAGFTEVPGFAGGTHFSTTDFSSFSCVAGVAGFDTGAILFSASIFTAGFISSAYAVNNIVVAKREKNVTFFMIYPFILIPYIIAKNEEPKLFLGF